MHRGLLADAPSSLGLVGYTLLSVRLGRNARYLSLGNAIAAGVMGGVGYNFSSQAIFFLTAALCYGALNPSSRHRPRSGTWCRAPGFTGTTVGMDSLLQNRR